MLRKITSFSQQNLAFKYKKFLPIIAMVEIAVISMGILLPRNVYSQTEDSLISQARRCRYYQMRSRAGDTTIYALLVMKQENSNAPTGAEQCFDVIDRYLNEGNLSDDEIRVYEFVQQYYQSLIERIPKDK